MKILHCCLACFYIDNYNYQENLLSIEHKKLGHDVKILASTETFIDNINIGYTKPGTYISKEGIPITRIEYAKIFSHKVMTKVRAYMGISEFLEDFKPDIIFIHGLQSYGTLNIIEYKKSNPQVKVFADSHEDKHNSATNFVSKNVLHKLFYKRIIRKALPYIEKILCLSYESIDFMNEIYNIPTEHLELYPLGGTIFEENIRKKKREKIREILKLDDSDILLVHSGKMSMSKKTDTILKALSKVKDKRLKLILIGSIEEEYLKELNPMINDDDRIKYLGWKNGDELIDYLHASDIYLQPGTQSATMQNAACSSTAIAIYPYESHKKLIGDKAFYIENENDIVKLLESVIKDRGILNIKKKELFLLAQTKLDYKVLAEKVL